MFAPRQLVRRPRRASGDDASLRTAPSSGAELSGTTEVLDPRLGWLPYDWGQHLHNPVHRFAPTADQSTVTDRIFPVVMRVDDKLAQPLDGHQSYLWVWRHGQYPRTSENGGRMQLLTADRLEGPWTDRGYVTPKTMAPDGWNPYSWTGGDVVWSQRHERFFSVPHAGREPGVWPPGIDSFLMESTDGVDWTLSSTDPVLTAGPEWYDAFETGYGRVLRVEDASGAEHWTWLYRSGYQDPDCPGDRGDRNQCYSLSVATAHDIYGPWSKAKHNPSLDPFAGALANPKGGGIIGLNAFVRHRERYQILWQGFTGDVHLSRSRDLRSWETFARYRLDGVVAPLGRDSSAPVSTPVGPEQVMSPGGGDARVR